MPNLYNTAQIRKLEAKAFCQIAPYDLMKIAATALFNQIQKHTPKTLIIFCGHGNNGGDGILLAVLASLSGIDVKVIFVGDKKKATPLVLQALIEAKKAFVPIMPFEEGQIYQADVLVDALLGIGLSGKPKGVFAKAITAFNQSQGYKVAVDLPSGLMADSGLVIDNLSTTVNLTITFIGHKVGLYLADGYDVTKSIYLASLGVDEALFNDVLPTLNLFLTKDVQKSLVKKRKNNTHKGQFGHVLIIGGMPGMGGAVLLAAQSVLKSGAGVVSILTHKSHAGALLSLLPEAMIYGLDDIEDNLSLINRLLDKATVVLCGMGLDSSDNWSRALLEKVIYCPGKKVLDAGALGFIAENGVDNISNALLTPHPGEAASLLGISNKAVQSNRIEAIKKLVLKTKQVVILKGAGQLIYGPDLDCPKVIPMANSALSTAGSGDVFAGMVAGLLAATQLSDIEVLQLACALQSYALIEALKFESEETLVASDLIKYFSHFFKGCYCE